MARPTAWRRSPRRDPNDEPSARTLTSPASLTSRGFKGPINPVSTRPAWATERVGERITPVSTPAVLFGEVAVQLRSYRSL